MDPSSQSCPFLPLKTAVIPTSSLLPRETPQHAKEEPEVPVHGCFILREVGETLRAGMTRTGGWTLGGGVVPSEVLNV